MFPVSGDSSNIEARRIGLTLDGASISEDQYQSLDQGLARLDERPRRSNSLLLFRPCSLLRRACSPKDPHRGRFVRVERR